MKNSDKLYDENEIKAIKERIASEIASDKNHWQNNAIQYLLAVITELCDEKESLWFMLDEEKNSKPNSGHTKMLNDLIENRLLYLKMLQGRKGEA
tara:strand:- start:255 stop:539 length:285 start_codon:yes stop_codon:yes gene_type:complete